MRDLGRECSPLILISILHYSITRYCTFTPAHAPSAKTVRAPVSVDEIFADLPREQFGQLPAP